MVEDTHKANEMEVDQSETPKTNGVTENLLDYDEDDNKLLIDTAESSTDVESVNENELLKSDNDLPNKVANGNVDPSEAATKPNTLNNEKSITKQSKDSEKSAADTSNAMEVDSVDNKKQVKTEKLERKEEIVNVDKTRNSKFEDNDDSCTENEEESKLQRINLQFQRVANLKEELLKEEAALTLFRKLFDSQRGRNGFKNNSVAPVSNNVKTSKQTHSMSKQAPSLKPVPPPQNLQSKPSSQHSQPAQKFYIQVGNQLVPAPPPVTNSYQQYNSSNTPSNTTSSYQSQPQPKPAPPAPPKPTPEQKKNAAKAALRRQLEQTLLQIPPPRPPPADWNAIPNVNSIDFMMLVGLDEIVDTILSFDNKPTLKNALEELRPFNPRVCAQCKVDFSPCWKAAKNSSMDEYVLCENCSLQNVKKELKAEHTSRLKSAFMKALKQEQEIEEKIKAGEDVNVPGMENDVSSHSPKVSQSSRVASPKPAPQNTHSSRSSGNHVPSPSERHHQSNGTHHHSNSGRHQVVQHYPHHSLVQQLHHQHIQQQQIELEPSSRHSSRWHPYISSSSGHHREHHPTHHRNSYVQNSSSEGSPRQEYYVVHHPHHYVAR